MIANLFCWSFLLNFSIVFSFINFTFSKFYSLSSLAFCLIWIFFLSFPAIAQLSYDMAKSFCRFLILSICSHLKCCVPYMISSNFWLSFVFSNCFYWLSCFCFYCIIFLFWSHISTIFLYRSRAFCSASRFSLIRCSWWILSQSDIFWPFWYFSTGRILSCTLAFRVWKAVW